MKFLFCSCERRASKQRACCVSNNSKHDLTFLQTLFLYSGDFEVEGLEKAYPEKSNKGNDDSGSSTLFIVIAIAGVVVIAVALAAFLLLRRRNEENEQNKQSMVMQQRVAMTHSGASTSNLIPTKDNMAYDGSDEDNGETFMFEMPTGLKSTSASEQSSDEGEKITDIGYYHGNMVAKDVNSLLQDCEAGSFVLYTNLEQNLAFAVRAPSGGSEAVRHFSVTKSDSGGKYTTQPGMTDGVTFDAVNKIMEHYSVHAITFVEDEPAVILKEPLLKSAL